MNTILGLEPVAIALIVALSGTVLYQLKAKGNNPLKKVIDGALASFTVSTFAVIEVLKQIPADATPEFQLGVIFAQIGIVAGGSAAGQKVVNKTRSKVRKRKFDKLTPPVLHPVGNWYQTNFIREQSGNALAADQNYLWIKLSGVRSYVSVMLRDSSGNVLQIDQSHALDEDNNVETCRLEMFDRTGKRLPKGKYSLQIQGDRGTGDSQGIKSDEFTIL